MSCETVFSIIVPVYREPELLAECLLSISRMPGSRRSEVIVVDGGGGSSMREINPQRFGFALQCVESRPGRGPQLNAGAARARGRYLVFLHVDTRLRRNGLNAIEEAMGAVAATAMDLYVCTRSAPVKAIAAVASIRSRVTRVPYGDQVHAFRADVFRELGGYPDIPIMEDVALMTKLKHHGLALRFARGYARNPDRRWRKEGVMRATARNWVLILAYRLGIAPDRLARHYRPHEDRNRV